MTEECCICFELLESTHTVSLKCQHHFHLECIKQITNNKCPLCRATIIDKPLCLKTHRTYFGTSFYNKKGKCMHCYGYSFKHLIKNKLTT